MPLMLSDVIEILATHQMPILNDLSQSHITQEELSTQIIGLASLATAELNEISFLANPKYQHELPNTHATAVLITADKLDLVPSHSVPLVVANPYLAYAILSEYFAYYPNHGATIHPTAIIAKTANIAKGVQIGAYCVIGEQVDIGENTCLENHVVIQDFTKIGNDCRIKSFAFVGHHCELGEFVTLHSHASIGNEGFGFAPNGRMDVEGWQKIHQLGKVVIGNHVRIGSQTCIDRGALGDTVIGNHVIIDNLVQIAHNVQIGDGTAIAACTGIAGSSKIGKRCVLAGGVGVVGHIDICDDVTITGMTMVTKSITQAGSYSSGTAMMPTPLWKKAAIRFKQLVTA